MVGLKYLENVILDKETGEGVEILYEKMSKSKYNGVDPKSAIDAHGADVVRLFLLFKVLLDFFLSVSAIFFLPQLVDRFSIIINASLYFFSIAHNLGANGIEFRLGHCSNTRSIEMDKESLGYGNALYPLF